MIRSFLAAALLLTTGVANVALAADFAARGIHAFRSDSGCPFASLGGADNVCNRIALDDEHTRANVDAAARTIRFTNTRRYPAKTVVADVVLEGSGVASDGKRVPLTFHLLLSRAGDAWSASGHSHAPVTGNFSAIQIDPYRVVVTDPKGAERVIQTPEQIAKTLASPSAAARLAQEFVQVRDSRGAEKNADITIGLGLGQAVKWVARARFESTPAADQNLDQLLKQGTWALELQALTGQIPQKVVRREIFLWGLEREPLMEPLLKRGFAKNERLIIGAEDGRGYIRVGEARQNFPTADAAARGFLQHGFMGLLLGWQNQQAHPNAR